MPEMVVILRGAINANHNTWGGRLYNGKELIESRRYDITDIVDRVGGGDSFMGGLIFGLFHYKDDKKILEFAIAASCLKHILKGDFNWVTVPEVENLMDGDTSGRVKRQNYKPWIFSVILEDLVIRLRAYSLSCIY